MGCGASTSASGQPLYTVEQPIPQQLQTWASESVTQPPQASASDDDALLADTIDIPKAAVSFTFASSTQEGKSIKTTSTANGLVDPAGSLIKSESHALMNQVDLGKLHAALKGDEHVSKERFTSVLKDLLSGPDAPQVEAMTALFRVFDVDDSGAIDESELIAGCQALCSGDKATKLKLAFSCFDKDGDGHLTPDEICSLLRGSLEPAVSALHGAIDFASYSSDGVDVSAINEEAGGAATLSTSSDPTRIKVELRSKVGTATLDVPLDALSPQALSEHGHHLSVDAFLGALVDDAMRKHDTDGNGSLEAEEFVAFAEANAFLSIFFGHLTQEGGRAKSSWKDDFSTS